MGKLKVDNSHGRRDIIGKLEPVSVIYCTRD